MTNEEILKKAIKKALSNGFKKPWHCDLCVIFSPAFAEAFWGEKNCYWNPCTMKSHPPLTREESREAAKHCKEPIWKAHLKNMVLEEEPLKYIKRFL